MLITIKGKEGKGNINSINNLNQHVHTIDLLVRQSQSGACMVLLFTLVSSTSLVTITIVVTLCSQIILQKSSNVLLTGTYAAMYAFGSL